MKKFTTKRAVFLSIVSMFLCFTMLLGTTYAWFTDNVTSGVNTIVAGNLDVELYNGLDVTTAPAVTENTRLFGGIDLWEPGAAVYENFTVANKGNLALKYQFDVVIADAAGYDSFAEVLKVGVVDGGIADNTTREAAIAAVDEWMSFETFSEVGTLAVNGSDKYGVVIYWEPSDRDNEFNMNNENSEKELKVTIGVNLFATQMEAESDSFGSDYDNAAPIASPSVARPAAGEDLDLTSAENNINVTVPAEVLDDLPAGVSSVAIAASTPVVDAVNKTVKFGSIELVDQDGNKIDLANLNAGAKVIVKLYVGDVFAEGEEVAIYHDDAFVAFAVATSDGYVTYEAEHFCEVNIKENDTELEIVDDVLTIATAEQLLAFSNDVNAGNNYAGKTVVLANNIDLAGVAWTPIGNVTFDRANSGSYVEKAVFKGTFDGKGYTISNLKIYAPSVNGVGLFGATKAATIKNVNIKNVDIVADGTVAALVGYTCDYNVKNYTTVDNCHVSGNISIVADWAYVGGIVAYGHANISNCSVIADGTGVLVSANRNAVAGIMGWNYGAYVTDCEVKNLDLTGWANIGAVEGYVGAGHTISGCKAENVTITKTRADGHPTVGLASGGWSYNASNAITIKNNSFKNVTFNGNYVAVASASLLYGAEYAGSLNTNFVLENNTDEGITNNLLEVVKVTTGDELKAALNSGKNVVLGNDITMAAGKGGYNKAGVTVSGGQILDGNGKTLTVTGAGGTWDCAIYTNGGTIKNITVAGAMRGIFTAGATTDIYIDNVIFKNVIYTFNSDAGNDAYGVYISNSQINGWTSYSAVHKEVIFENCTFAEGSGYKFCRPYMAVTFINCDFAEGYKKIDNLDTATFENCTFGGTLITADNVADFVNNPARAIVK